jgi:tRNA A-37 threonylcarbamoyl transferase component Bud32
VSEPRWESLTRADVDRLTVQIYRTAWRARPEVRRIRMLGRDAVVKDYGRCGNIFKHLLGTFLATREATALQRAEGIANIPAFYALARPWILVTEHLDARRVTDLTEDERPGLLTPAFFEKLTTLIAQLHSRGIAHGDLEKLDNILITPEGDPAVVDFAAAIMSGINPLAALALPLVEQNDRRAVYKLKSRFAPHLLTDEEDEKLHTRGRAEVLFRRARKYIRRPVKSLAAGEDEQDSTRPATRTTDD